MGTPITTLAQLLAKADGGYGIRVRNTTTRALTLGEPNTTRTVTLPLGTPAPGAWVELGTWFTSPDIAVSYEIRDWFVRGWIDAEATDVGLALSPLCSHGVEVECAYDGATNPATFALGGDCRGFRIVAITGDDVRIKTRGATAGEDTDYKEVAASGQEYPYAGLDQIHIYFGATPEIGDTVVIRKHLIGDPALS